MANSNIKIALVGNPNIGKTTLFNTLCGLSQKTGNYPGVTVDKKKGYFSDDKNNNFEIIDLPGINSLYPKSKDEELVVKYLENNNKPDYPDKIIVTVSALNLKRNLYLFHQVRDLNIPVILAVNMIDIAEKRGIFINAQKLSEQVGCPVVKVSAKSGQGIQELKTLLTQPYDYQELPISYTTKLTTTELEALKQAFNKSSNYQVFVALSKSEIEKDELLKEKNTTARQLKINESILRYKNINTYLQDVLTVDKNQATDFTTNLDKYLLHPILGYFIFGAIMFVIFQSLFAIASYPMDWIDYGVSFVAEQSKALLPQGYFNDLVTDGIIPGVGGVIIFIPQIVILFLFFSFLEESGYMSRIIFLMDKLMQKFGMSGKSVVPLMSSLACAIPGIMAARTIENKKERLITILVAPLLTCSARLPVYVVLISLVVPDTYWGPFNLQGLTMFLMYFIGVFAAMLAALVFKFILKSTYKSTLIMEMPQYLWPSFKNIFIKVYENATSFVVNAGKIILATSIILFVLATNGGDDFSNAESKISKEFPTISTEEKDQKIAALQLKNSYLGTIGKVIEPAIEPLGYDWKIGIALVSSLAAREVFVGTISTIYSINSEETLTIKNRLKQEKDPETGLLIFNFATAISLLLFYAFSLQCFSTVAVTYKETKSIKWTAIQFFYMSTFAYLAALISYQLLK